MSNVVVPINPETVYFDLTITNVKSELTPPVPIYFNESRTNPIINNSGDYRLSITRFSVDTQTLPVWIPEIQANQNDRDKTIYSVSMSYLPASSSDGTTFIVQQYIQWSPQNVNAPIPNPPSETGTGVQSNAGDYYYAYSFQWVILQVYKAFQACFASLQQKVLASGYTDLENVLPPIITWNPDTSCAVISAESSFFNGHSTYVPTPVENPNAVKIYFNSPLFSLFSSFPFTMYGSSASQGMNNRILIEDMTGSNTLLLPSYSQTGSTQYVCTQVYQEYSCIANWTPISAIVFCSSTLPLVPEQMSAPLVFNEKRAVSVGNNAMFQMVITDLVSSDNCYKPNLLYSPTAQYRYISMTQQATVTNIDVSLFWKNRFGQFIPMLLPSGGTCSIKFLFEKLKS
jgi:hypothetical protein